MFEFQPDRAISSIEADRLDRGRFVESISNTLVSAQDASSTGIVVGLVGQWGEGKSSILQLLRTDLRKRFPTAVVVDFSPWLVSQRNDLLHAFFDELDRCLSSYLEEPIHGSRRSQAIEELSSAIADYVERVAPVLELLHSGSEKAVKAATFPLRFLSKVYQDRRAKDRRLAHLKDRVDRLLGALEIPVVVLVDEVDRIDDHDIRELMHLVKAVADFPSISYVIAYDEVRVAEALGHEAPRIGERLSRGRKYLEKIVQIPLPLPIIFGEEIAAILDEEIRKVLEINGIVSGQVNEDRYQDLKKILIPGCLETVRDVRRLVGSFAHRLGLMPGDVEWPDVLGFLALLTCAPALSAKIRMAPEKFVFDGHLSRYLDQRNADQRFESLTERSERQEHIKKLFSFLFPAVMGTRNSMDCLLDEIAFKRPLFTILRMKVMSTAVSRNDMISIVSLVDSEQRRAIEEIVRAGSGTSFAERLADYQGSGTQSKFEGTWVLLLQAADLQPVDSWSKFEMRMVQLRDVTDVFVSLLRRPTQMNMDVRSILTNLAATEAYQSSSIIIRRMLMRLTRSGSAFGEVLERFRIDIHGLCEIGKEIVAQAKAHYANSQQALPVGIVYLAKDLKMWRADDRQAYTEILLGSDREFDAFVVSCFGGGYFTEGDAIYSDFMNREVFILKAKSRINAPEVLADITLRKAYGGIREMLGMLDDGHAHV